MTLKEIKMDTWTSRCPVGVPVDPWITKMDTQGTQNGVSRCANDSFLREKVTQFSSQPAFSSLQSRGPAAEAKP